MADPVDLPELRRLAEAATTDSRFTRELAKTLTDFHVAVSPRVVLALLDRIDALEARLAVVEPTEAPGLTYLYGTGHRRHVHDGTAPHQGQHRARCGGWFYTASAFLADHPAPEDRLAELSRLPVCRRCADPGAVAGEPESEETSNG